MNEIKLGELNFFQAKKQEIEHEMADINVYEITSKEDYEQALIDRKKLKDLIDKTERFRIDFNKEFTTRIKELYAPINTVLDKFEKRIEAHKDWLDANKTVEIVEIMKELNSPLSVERMLENDFFDKRYLNKSYKIEDIKLDLQKKVDKVYMDLDIISKISDHVRLKELYLKHLNIKQAHDEFDLEMKAFVPNVPDKEVVKSIKITALDSDLSKVINFLNALNIKYEPLD